MKKLEMDNEKWTDVSCPLCASNQTTSLYTVVSTEVVQYLNLEQHRSLASIIEKLWNGNSGQFYKCQTCTFTFAWPFISGNKEFYSKIYGDVNYYPKDKWDYSVTYHSISKIINKSNSNDINLLEIGAGNGSFIKSISPSLVSKKNILCTEFSDYGKEEMLKYGIKCLAVDLKDIDPVYEQSPFDIVCMFQVFEHMDSHDEFFKKINKITKKKAHLFMTVPNHKYREFYDKRGSRFDIPPIHVSRWNKSTFKILCEKYQWELIEHKIENPPFLKKLRKFLFNRYHRFTFSKLVEKIKTKNLNLTIKLLMFMGMIVIYFPSIIKIFIMELGVTQWAHLQKNSSD